MKNQFSVVSSPLFIKVKAWLELYVLSTKVIESQFVMLLEPEPDIKQFLKTIGPLLDRIVDALTPEL